MQQVTLGAKRDGTLTALRHAGTCQTSMLDEFTEPIALTTRILYPCPNVETSHRLVRVNAGSPAFMRAPGESSGSFAIESAMDELAYKLKMDPIALRLKNYPERDPESGMPWSSNSLRECFRVGAERFGWSRRSPEPRSMRDGRWLVGYGVSPATYPANRATASAVARILPDGRAIMQAGSQDIGTGTYTVMTQIAADALGLPPESVRFELGDTHLPETPNSGGSQTAATVGSAVHQAALAVRSKVVQLAIQDAASPLYNASEEEVLVENGRLALRSNRARGETYAAVLARHGGEPIEAQVESKPGAERQQYAMHSFGAQFASVRVDADTGEVHVSRFVGVYGVGRILNMKTARSQLTGAIVMGIGMALHEETVTDARYGRIVNASLGEYHVPVNADIGAIDVSVVDEKDLHLNPIGVKGIGEIGIVGTAAAIANAVFHATGKRIRDLPITPDTLL
jgi:xanthine dehydrogenase YagR molybdenum-binding subunit